MGRISRLHEYTLDKINSKFPHLKARENYYPDWLTSPIGTRLELDIFIDDLNIAAEIQGGQHSFFVPFFHVTQEKFEKQKMYDEHKQSVCRSVGVKLYDISTEKDADIMVYEIGELINSMDENAPKYLYQDVSHKTERWHEVERRKALGLTRKQMKKETVNSPERMERRLASCKANLSKYESGEIDVPIEKVLSWKMVIQNNGREDILHDEKGVR